MSLTEVLDVAATASFVVGTFFIFAAAIGLSRFPDLLSRLHAAAKPQVVGLIFMLLGLVLSVRDPFVTWTCVLVLLFQLITAPISAHFAARAGYRTGLVDSGKLYTDEYRRDLVKALRRERRGKVK